jgi:hypothetical protein
MLTVSNSTNIVCLVRLVPAMFAVISWDIRRVDYLDFSDKDLRVEERYMMRGRSEGSPPVRTTQTNATAYHALEHMLPSMLFNHLWLPQGVFALGCVHHTRIRNHVILERVLLE